MQRGSSDQLDNPKMPLVFKFRNNSACVAPHLQAKGGHGAGMHLRLSNVILLMLTGAVAGFTAILVGRGPEYFGLCSSLAASQDQKELFAERQPVVDPSGSLMQEQAADSLTVVPKPPQDLEPVVRRHKVAICTSIKWEHPEDVEEWVRYYQWLGVSNIGLVENSETLTPALEEKLAPYVVSGFVNLKAWGDDTPAQIKIFDSCFARFKHTHDWVAFFDADEYLVLLESGSTLDTLLDDYKDYPALAVNWIMFGSNNRLTRPEGGGVLRWYSQCRATPEPHIKVIARTSEVHAVLSPHPHNIFYKNESHAVGENFERVEHVYGDECVESDKCTAHCRTDCRAQPGYKVPQNELKRVALLHYVVRSWEDYETKMNRGGGSTLDVRKDVPFFDCTNREANSTGGICDEGIKAWAKCCAS